MSATACYSWRNARLRGAPAYALHARPASHSAREVLLHKICTPRTAGTTLRSVLGTTSDLVRRLIKHFRCRGVKMSVARYVCLLRVYCEWAGILLSAERR